MQTEKKWSVPLAFLYPLCTEQQADTKGCYLEHLGANPIFDRNVIGVVAQFLVGLFRMLSVCDTHVRLCRLPRVPVFSANGI